MSTIYKIVGKVNKLPDGYKVVDNITNHVVDFGSDGRHVIEKNSQIIIKSRRCVHFGSKKQLVQSDDNCSSCPNTGRVACPSNEDIIVPALILDTSS